VSVVTVEDVQYESWGGFDDPRLPSGIWKSLGAVLGDASGGNADVFARFNSAGVERLDRMYSLEEVHIHSTSSTGHLGLLQARNFGSVKTGVRQFSVRVLTQTTEAGTPGTSPEDAETAAKTFLGQQVFRTTPLEVVYILDNEDGITTTVWLGGYVWGPRSASAKNGGPLRPNPGHFPQ